MTVHDFEEERRRRAEADAADVEEPRPDPETIEFDELVFSGERIAEVADRPPVESPLPGYFDPEPGLQGIYGRSASGKTTLAL